MRILYILFFSLLLFSCGANKDQNFLLPEGRPICANSAIEDINNGKLRLLMAGFSPPSDTIVISTKDHKYRLERISVAGCLVEDGLIKK